MIVGEGEGRRKGKEGEGGGRRRGQTTINRRRLTTDDGEMWRDEDGGRRRGGDGMARGREVGGCCKVLVS